MAKTWLADIGGIRAAGARALAEGRDQCEVGSRLALALPSGLRVADVRMTIRIDVTIGERAAGAFRGEDREAIAGRETVETAIATGAVLGEAASEALGRLSMLRAEIEQFLSRFDADGPGRGAWRARALASEIRDLVDDNPAAGLRASLDNTPADLLGLEAWVPVAPSRNISLEDLGERLAAQVRGGDTGRAIAALSEIRDQLAPSFRGAFEVFGTALTADIARLTPDVSQRHLLEEAANLRDRAAEFVTADRERAEEIMARAQEIEDQALAAIDAAAGKAALDDLQDSATALGIQAGTKFKR